MANPKEFTVNRPGVTDHSSRFNKKKERLENPWGTTWRILQYLGSKKWALVVIFLLSIIVTITSIIGTRINGYAVDNYIQKLDLAGLGYICMVLGIIYVVNIAATFFQNRLMVYIAQLTSSNIRKDLFVSIQSLPLKYFDTHSSGDIMSRLTNDVDNISMTLSQSVTQFFSGIINILGMLLAMLILSPTLTMVTMITTPLMLLITKVLVSKTQPYFVKQQRELGNLNGYIEEMISAQKTVLLFSEEEKVKQQFSVINKRLTSSAIFAQGFSGFMGPINNFINNLSYVIVAVFGGYLAISGKDGLTVGVILTFIIYMRNFTRPINEILNLFNTIQSALAGGERVFDVIDEEKEKDDLGAEELKDIDGHVKFEKVNFSYSADKKILENLSLEAEKGSLVAVVGPTGSGKTTIINLLTNFYNIDSGKITIDDKDINSITKESLRKNVSMVLQDTFLFSETVMENIRYGNIIATDSEVIEAAKLANAHNFIMQLPKGYNTVLSDNGGDLSHGQRQLLAIARASVAKASILILDEATSSIDTRTEMEIQKALLNLMNGKTTFVIAHRLSTIKNANKIIVLKDGQIVETGTHGDLIEKGGFYADLYNSQFSTGLA
ncbi:ABC transporter ATP-binding protein [Clostridium sp.]|uniref:ABC transporter ATP-binding protein n=1 Tax=Clostridium sp. TaxID=1506 RepID=UPI002FC5ADC5